MIRKTKGFTLIEVALFLAITGAIFIGVIAGTQNSIWQQRTNDTVQGFAEFLRGVYSSVSNPQGEDSQSGKSGQAIYGRLLVFGEDRKLNNESNTTDSPDYQQLIYVYTVIGDADVKDTGNGGLTSLLEAIHANVLVRKNNTVDYAGIVESYIPRWAAQIEPIDGSRPFKGSVLIVRHPVTGVIKTLYSNNVVEVNKAKNEPASEGSSTADNVLSGSVLREFSESGNNDKGIDFCINPYGFGEEYNNRYDVRIVKNANNASGVEVVDRDSADNVCKRGA